jgi:hypothetical protein
VQSVAEIGWARAEARRKLEPLGRRWAHSLAVAAQAELLRATFDERRGDQLVAAAYLHDIGYAPDLVVTGFHPLDGAMWLEGLVDPEVVSLVGHHSCAWVEADMRCLGPRLMDVPRPEGELLDALTYCDMTSGPAGERMTLDERLAEIVERYGPGHLVTESIQAATRYLREAIARAEQRCGAALLAAQPR